MAWAILAAVAGCTTDPDPEQPIGLVISDGAFSIQELQALDFAAEGWNREFGTQIVVIEGGSDTRHIEQQVEVTSSEQTCEAAAGLAHTKDRLAIDLCATLESKQDLLIVARHEIGHILGLGHAESAPAAVMAPSRQVAVPRFEPADHQLFAKAHPGFRGRDDERLGDLGPVANAPTAVAPDLDGAAVAAQADGDRIRVARLDDQTGGLADDPAEIVARAPVEWLGLRSSPSGLDLNWIAEGILHSARADDSSRITQPVPIETVTLPYDLGNLRQVSVARHGDDLFIATSRNHAPTSSRTVQLHRVDGATGTPRELDYASLGAIEATSGPPLFVGVSLATFVSSAEGLYLAQLEADGPVLRRVVDGRAVETLAIDVPTYNLAVNESGDGALVVAWQPWTSSRTLVIQQVKTEPTLALGVQRRLTLPGVGDRSPVVAVAHNARTDQLLLAVTRREPGWSETAVFALIVDSATMAPAGPWRRLSPIDLISSASPHAAASNDGFVVTWQDQHPGELAKTRSRRLAALATAEPEGPSPQP